MIEIITLIVAVIGGALSVYNFGHEKFQNRMRLKVTYKNHSFSKNDNSLFVSLAFENKVQNPISVSRIFLKIGTITQEFYWIPVHIHDQTITSGRKTIDKIPIRSVQIPFKIEGHGVVGGFFYTTFPKDIDLVNLLIEHNTAFIMVHSSKGIKTYPIPFDCTELER